MRPSLRHLEIFQLFSRVLNVTETARILRVTQPSVSQALRDFEAQLGVALLIRTKSGLRLTPAAETLLKDIDAILDGMQRLSDRATRLKGEQASQLSIASVLPLTGVIVPQAIRTLREKLPDTRFTVETYSSREVIAKVRDRSVDIGLTFLPIDVPDLIQHPLMTTEMACLMQATHPLAARESVSPEDLENETVITLGAQVRQEFDARLAFNRDLDDPRFVTTNLSSISADMVREGLGVAITLPFAVQHIRGDDIVLRAFTPKIRRSLVAIFAPEPGLTTVGRKFIKQVHAELRGYARVLEASGIKSRVPAP